MNFVQLLSLHAWLPRSPLQSDTASFVATGALVSLVFYAWFVQINSKEIMTVAASVFNVRNWGKPVKLPSLSARLGARRRTVSFILAWLGLSWLVYSFLEQTGFAWSPVYTALFSLLAVLVCYVVKNVLLQGVSRIFEEHAFGAAMIQNGIFHDIIFSLIALPILTLMACTPSPVRLWVLRILFLVFSIFLVYKILHLVYEGIRLSRFSHLHIFVYLCALEILLPLCIWGFILTYNQ